MSAPLLKGLLLTTFAQSRRDETSRGMGIISSQGQGRGQGGAGLGPSLFSHQPLVLEQGLQHIDIVLRTEQ